MASLRGWLSRLRRRRAGGFDLGAVQEGNVLFLRRADFLGHIEPDAPQLTEQQRAAHPDDGRAVLPLRSRASAAIAPF